MAYCLASLIALGDIGRRKEPITVSAIMGALFYWGILGLALSMVGYEYFGWKRKPAAVVASGILGGCRAIKASDLAAMARRLLAIKETDEPPNHRKTK